ncbi:MAG: hypothetical protein ACJARL_001575 [Halopseudomonas sp.]|jgi:hypothetical protein
MLLLPIDGLPWGTGPVYAELEAFRNGQCTDVVAVVRAGSKLRQGNGCHSLYQLLHLLMLLGWLFAKSCCSEAECAKRLLRPIQLGCALQKACHFSFIVIFQTVNLPAQSGLWPLAFIGAPTWCATLLQRAYIGHKSVVR